MRYDPQIHRRKTIRLKGYDYSSPGAYFVTICSHNRQSTLGFIKNEEVFLSEWGRIVLEIWEEIPHHHSQIALDEFVIMPNHVHGILWVTDLESGSAGSAPTTEKTKFGKILPKSLPSVIRSFKSEVTREINLSRKLQGERFWQRNYFEHIVRNDDDLFNIRKYIQENPAKWESDRYFSPR